MKDEVELRDSLLHFTTVVKLRLFVFDMAKINKKNIEEKKKNAAGKYNLKEFPVNVSRMSEKEHKFYTKSDVIIVKNLSVKITNNTMKVGSSKQKCDDNGTFNITLRNGLSDIVLEHCEVKPKISTVAASEKPSRKLVAKTLNNHINTAEHREVMPKISTVAALEKPTPELVAKTLNDHINDAWKSCKKNFLDSNLAVNVDDIVMARMKTYSAWPGKILTLATNKKRASIHFFGTNNRGSVDVKEIVPFEYSHDAIKLLLLRKRGPFHKGVLEIETILGVPPNLSLLKEIESLK